MLGEFNLSELAKELMTPEDLVDLLTQQAEGIKLGGIPLASEMELPSPAVARLGQIINGERGEMADQKIKEYYGLDKMPLHWSPGKLSEAAQMVASVHYQSSRLLELIATLAANKAPWSETQYLRIVTENTVEAQEFLGFGLYAVLRQAHTAPQANFRSYHNYVREAVDDLDQFGLKRLSAILEKQKKVLEVNTFKDLGLELKRGGNNGS